MAMSIKLTIQEDMKSAMRAREKQRLGTIRMALAAIKQIEVDERIELDDARVVAVLDKMVKQRTESAAQYAAAERPELAEQENAEIQILREYLPSPLTPEELQQLIADAVADTGATSMRDMGRVMGIIKQQAQGRAEMQQVSATVKAALS